MFFKFPSFFLANFCVYHAGIMINMAFIVCNFEEYILICILESITPVSKIIQLHFSDWRQSKLGISKQTKVGILVTTNVECRRKWLLL